MACASIPEQRAVPVQAHGFAPSPHDQLSPLSPLQFSEQAVRFPAAGRSARESALAGLSCVFQKNPSNMPAATPAERPGLNELRLAAAGMGLPAGSCTSCVSQKLPVARRLQDRNERISHQDSGSRTWSRASLRMIFYSRLPPPSPRRCHVPIPRDKPGGFFTLITRPGLSAAYQQIIFCRAMKAGICSTSQLPSAGQACDASGVV